MRRGAEAGLTLVEVLVVLAIIGVMSGVAVFGLGGASRGATVQAEAQRLAASVQLASDEALVTDRRLALRWDGRGYSFVQWNGGEWQPHQAESLGARHELPAAMELAGDSREDIVPIGEAAGASVDFTVSAGEQSWRVQFDGLNAAAVPAIDG